MMTAQNTQGFTGDELADLNLIAERISAETSADESNVADAILNAVGETFDPAQIERSARRVLGL